MTPETLSGDEARLIDRLRDVPPGPVHDELVAFLCDLIDFVRDPRCGYAQADGVPCDDVETACEDCCDVPAVLSHLHRRLPN